MRSSHVLDGLAVTFDDEHAVAAAGLVLPATLAGRLGIEALADELIDLGDKPGAHRPGRKVMTLMHSLVLGGDCIDDADVLRVGSTGAVLGHRVMAPSTLARFSGRSRSGMCASLTSWRQRPCPGPGRREWGRATPR